MTLRNEENRSKGTAARNKLGKHTQTPSCPRGNDLFDLAEKLRISGKEMPEILSICGTEDFMIEDNRKFNRFMRKIEYPGFYSFERPGSHTWEFWDQYIQDVMVFFTTGQLPEK